MSGGTARVAAGYNQRMIAADIVAAIRARLALALARAAGKYRPLWIESDIVGWLDDARAARLAEFGDVFLLRPDGIRFVAGVATPDARTGALHRVVSALASAGQLTAWRDERYAVAPAFGVAPCFLLERAAARFFGIQTYAVHVNGLVESGGGPRMWIARRSPGKAIDPGLLDNLVGGGIAAGADVRHTVVKEAWEEAGIAPPLARNATPAGAVHICRAQPDGLQRESIFVHDLALPADFAPAGQDGEVVDYRLVAIEDAGRLVANAEGADVVTADASLVIADCLLRRGMIAPDLPDYLALESLRHPPLRPDRERQPAPVPPGAEPPFKPGEP
jgi:8-oxo-dGTP pyrophosphatase MutT (NUDIX family)